MKENHDIRYAKVDRPSSSADPDDVLGWALLNAGNGELSNEDLAYERGHCYALADIL